VSRGIRSRNSAPLRTPVVSGALKTLVAEPALISPAAECDPKDVYEALRKHGAKSDLLQIVGSWQDTRDDQWVLNELRRWNTRGR
jgi:hypothetical protein